MDDLRKSLAEADAVVREKGDVPVQVYNEFREQMTARLHRMASERPFYDVGFNVFYDVCFIS